MDLSDGNWTVALSGIAYPLTFSGVEEEQRITIHYENKEPVTILIPKRVQYNSIEEMENLLNETIITTLFNDRASSKKCPKRERPVAKACDLSKRPVAQPKNRSTKCPNKRRIFPTSTSQSNTLIYSRNN